jgi:hypothetical protein
MSSQRSKIIALHSIVAIGPGVDLFSTYVDPDLQWHVGSAFRIFLPNNCYDLT